MGFIIIILAVFLGDLLLKKYVEAKLPEGEERTLFRGKIRIRKYHNSGIALGGLSGHPLIIKRGTAGIILGLLIALASMLPKKGNTLRKTGLSLMLGGALCNWFDRFHQGMVTDYFSFRSKWRRFSRLVFNLSDICIFLGGLLALLGAGKKRK